jgi:hypothetical protein
MRGRICQTAADSFQHRCHVNQSSRERIPSHLSPFHPLLRRLGESLEHAGERMPRAAFTWWVGGGEARRIELISELRACLRARHGMALRPAARHGWQTLRQASDEARRRVEQAETGGGRAASDDWPRIANASRKVISILLVITKVLLPGS